MTDPHSISNASSFREAAASLAAERIRIEESAAVGFMHLLAEIFERHPAVQWAALRYDDDSREMDLTLGADAHARGQIAFLEISPWLEAQESRRRAGDKNYKHWQIPEELSSMTSAEARAAIHAGREAVRTLELADPRAMDCSAALARGIQVLRRPPSGKPSAMDCALGLGLPNLAAAVERAALGSEAPVGMPGPKKASI